MQTIVVKLCPGKLQNPDLDIRYRLPDAVERYTEGRITDNGYDYLDEDPAGSDALGIWLACENAAEGVNDVLTVMRRETICGNDLSQSAEIYISEKDTDDIENCQKVYPFDSGDSVSRKSTTYEYNQMLKGRSNPCARATERERHRLQAFPAPRTDECTLHHAGAGKLPMTSARVSAHETAALRLHE